jgi:hypothetical protein
MFTSFLGVEAMSKSRAVVCAAWFQERHLGAERSATRPRLGVDFF